MTKKLLIWVLTMAVTLGTMTVALADDSVATPSDMYEYEENDGHVHWVKCAAPDVCIWCGATVSTTRMTHEYKAYPFSETHHQVRCALCGEVEGMIEHTAYCDAPDKCGVCGETGIVIKSVNHDEALAYDADNHYWQCIRCKEITSRKQAHYATCYVKDGTCERCGAPFNGPVWHSHGTNVAGHDATYHWFKCEWCGKDIREKHYILNYYWYEHEDDSGLLCGGCGEPFDPAAVGAGQTSRKPASGSVGSGSVSAVNGFTAGSRAIPKTAETMTVAALHGNTEGLPMALIYAPKSGKATLREKASADARALLTLKDGAVVTVLSEGHRYTQVRVGDQVGYVLNGVLEPIDPWQLPMGEGMLVYPTTGGRGTTTINVRGEATNQSCKIDEWVTGAMVTVWSVTDKGDWYEVELDGVRGYVYADFLNITETYDFSEAEETETTETDVVEEA